MTYRFLVLTGVASLVGVGCGSDHVASQGLAGAVSRDASVLDDASGGADAPIDASAGNVVDAATDTSQNPDGSSIEAGALGGLHVEGSKLVDSGKTVRLLGVNISGTETYCEQGIGIFQAPTTGGGVDPNLAASHHNYSFNGGCNTQSCWTTNLAAVAASVPIITGELGENDCAHGYVDSYFAWADPLGISYVGWTWNNWNCGSGPALVTDFYGTPTSTYGEGFKAHLLTQ